MNCFACKKSRMNIYGTKHHSFIYSLVLYVEQVLNSKQKTFKSKYKHQRRCATLKTTKMTKAA